MKKNIKKPRYSHRLRRVMTTYDDVFEDVMSYEGIDISDDKFQSPDDVINEVLDNDVGGNMSMRLLNEFRNSDVMRDRFSGDGVYEDDRLRREAVSSEFGRGKRSRRVDEGKTTKRKVLDVSVENLRKWKRNPDKFDFGGVDTKSHRLIKEEIRRRSKVYSGKGYKVYRRGDVSVFVVRRDSLNRPYAQSIITGRRVSRGEYRRFGRLRVLANKNKKVLRG